MRETTVPDNFRSPLEMWMDGITETDLQRFQEILENQQYHLLLDDKLRPRNIKYTLKGVNFVFSQLKAIKAAKSQRK